MSERTAGIDPPSLHFGAPIIDTIFNLSFNSSVRTGQLDIGCMIQSRQRNYDVKEGFTAVNHSLIIIYALYKCMEIMFHYYKKQYLDLKDKLPWTLPVCFSIVPCSVLIKDLLNQLGYFLIICIL